LREQRIKVGYPKINHERLLARREIVAVGGKGRPDRVSLALGANGTLTLAERNAAIFLHLQPEIFAILRAKLFRINRLEENPADASDVFHTSGRLAQAIGYDKSPPNQHRSHYLTKASARAEWLQLGSFLMPCRQHFRFTFR
jgi:hypothetical protein